MIAAVCSQILLRGMPLLRAAIASAVMGAVLAAAAPAAESPTGRRTTDRNADLIAALIDQGQYGVAEAICQRHLAVAPGGTPENAAWSIRLSSVRIAGLLAAGVDEDEAWRAAREPLERALSGYESSALAPWLQLQRLLVELARSESRGMRFLANPADTATRDAMLEGLRGAIAGLRELDARLAEMIPLVNAGRLPEAAAAADLIRLQQTVRHRVVEALLLRGDAYPPGSDDALAAATEAEQAAESLLQSSAADATAREAAVRMRAEARRRSGDPGAAVALLQSFLQENGSVEPATIAELVLAELEQGHREEAAQWLDAFYGERPAAAPRSLEMDLARLRYLTHDAEAAATRGEIAAWIEQIGHRNGAYARRRAETEMLQVVRVEPSEGNATLMAARAGELLRSGRPQGAAEAAHLLAEASLAAERDDPAEAFRLGVQSGAVLVKLGRHAEAARQFAAVATRMADQPHAAAVHFEAARQQAKHLAAAPPEQAAAASEAVERMLEDQLRRWPESEEAIAARLWLIRIREAAGEFARAAEVALRLPTGAVEWPAAIRQAGRLWRQALAASDDPRQRQETASQALAALARVAQPHAAIAAEERNLIAAVTLDREPLQANWVQSPPADDEDALGDFAADLHRVRLGSVDPRGIALSVPDVPDRETIVYLALQRLRDDAAAYPAERERLGRSMLRIIEGAGSGGPAREFLEAEAMALSGDWRAAAERIERIAEGPPRQPAALRRGAQLLGSLDDPQAKERAIEIWSRLSAGLPKGSDGWHEAKLATIELMAARGDASEAAKLARFVLLTQPPADPTLKAAYQRWSSR